MIATTLTDAERYVAAVRAHLADLPEAERDDLLEDLSDHLAEVAAESDEPLEQRLGPPQRYAEELRTSAGLSAARDAGRAAAWAASLRGSAAAVTSHPSLAATRDFLPQLLPAWWVLRGYAIVAWLGLLQHGYALSVLPTPALLGSRLVGVLLAGAAIVASIRLGRQNTGRARPLNIVVNLLGALAVFGVTGAVQTVTEQAHYLSHNGTGVIYDGAADQDPQSDNTNLVRSNGRPVFNIYPFDEQGQPLSNVRLYDERGKPLHLVVETDRQGRSVVTSYPLDADGRPVTNAFPQHHAVRRNPYGDAQASPLTTRPDVTVAPLAAATPQPTPSPSAKTSAPTKQAASEAPRPAKRRPQRRDR